ncbi:hypothetical protein F2Q70_00015546 [Brassica cretica]|uniref:Uncharacterized protein n=1 Tax=Brassica cretica TaxID=69181 RepID=A0A8S9I2Q8_BRACR|nr:hypothetical protein F2Q70_00015546 [Brassica cretica]
MENKNNHGNEDGPKHSQVVKIKKEFEKISQPSLHQPEMRRDLVTPASPVARSESPSGQYAGPRIVFWLFCSVDHHSCCRYRSTGIS